MADGYRDPTFMEVVSREGAEDAKARKLICYLKKTIESRGFRLINRISIVAENSNKVYTSRL